MTHNMFPIAPKDMSGAFCNRCGKHVHMSDEKKVVDCLYRCCGQSLYSESLFDNKQIALRSTSAKFIHTENIQNEVWFHATDRAYWYENLFVPQQPTPLIHLGTLLSAMERYNHKKEHTPNLQDWQLHVISIRASATIAPKIIRDDNDKAPRLVEHCWNRKAYDYDIVPYVNQWEAIGEVSLFANPEKITVLETLNFADLPATLGV